MISWRSRSVVALLPLLNPVRDLIEKGELKEARKMVKDAYPFGQREYTPYKIWCEEVRRYLPGLYPQRKIPVNEQGVPLFR